MWAHKRIQGLNLKMFHNFRFLSRYNSVLNILGVEQRISKLLHPAWFCKHQAKLSHRTWGVCRPHNLPSKSEMYRHPRNSNAVKTSNNILKPLLWNTGSQCCESGFWVLVLGSTNHFWSFTAKQCCKHSSNQLKWRRTCFKMKNKKS